MSFSRITPRQSSPQSRKHQLSRSCLRRRLTRLTPAWSLVWPGRVVTSPACRTDLAGKRIELLRELVPGLRRLAFLAQPDNPYVVFDMRQAQAAARTLGLETASLEIRRAEDIAPAYEGLKSRAEALYILPDPLPIRPSPSHQHFGARRAVADDSQPSGVRRSKRSDVLWTKLVGPVAARGRLCRQNTARGEARRSPGRAANQVRSHHQSDYCQGTRPDNPGGVPAARRRGDRMNN